jgi:hypothetical protein
VSYEIYFDYWESEHDLQCWEARDLIARDLEWMLRDLEFVEIDSVRADVNSRGYAVLRCSDPEPMTEDRLVRLLDNYDDIRNVRIEEIPE